MKRCPTCNNTFSGDSGNFCPTDGSVLVDLSDPRSTDPSPSDKPASTQEGEPHIELTDTIDGVTLLAQPPVSAPGIMPVQKKAGSGKKLLIYIGTALIGFVIIGIVAGIIISYELTDSDNKNRAITKNPDTVVPELTTSATPRSTPTPEPPSDIDGTWTGTFDKASSTMIISKKDEKSFTGMITSKEFQIAIAGRYDSDSRKIDFKETKVLRSDDDRKLGTNNGRVSGNGRRMSGKGKSTKEYTWSFTKNRS